MTIEKARKILWEHIRTFDANDPFGHQERDLLEAWRMFEDMSYQVGALTRIINKALNERERQ
jgi:hypothetical protein